MSKFFVLYSGCKCCDCKLLKDFCGKVHYCCDRVMKCFIVLVEKVLCSCPRLFIYMSTFKYTEIFLNVFGCI